jgi:hypothetical protein
MPDLMRDSRRAAPPAYLFLAVWDKQASKPQKHLFEGQKSIQDWMVSQNIDGVTLVNLRSFTIQFQKRISAVEKRRQTARHTLITALQSRRQALSALQNSRKNS